MAKSFFGLLFATFAYILLGEHMKKIFSFLLIIVTGFFIFNLSLKAEDALCPNAKSAVLIDEASGKIMFEKNKDFRLAPASMTKVMTLAIIYDYMAKGSLSLDDIITTSEHAKSMGGSNIYLEVGEKMSVDEMLKCICIVSANDAAVAVAERVAGSEKAFVELMNKKAEELGMKNTHYMDVTGLENKNHYTSAMDMAIISRYLLNNYKDKVLKYTSIREDYIRKDTKPFWLVNTNKLIGKVDDVDGLKTGWTVAAGYCLTATSNRNNNRLISVVMGYSSPIVRNSETVELLNYGYASYKFCCIVEKGIVVKEIDNIKYLPAKIEVVTGREVIYVGKINDEDPQVTYEIQLDELSETISKNQVIGKYLVYCNNELYETIDLVAATDVCKTNLWQLFIEIVKRIFI